MAKLGERLNELINQRYQQVKLNPMTTGIEAVLKKLIEDSGVGKIKETYRFRNLADNSIELQADVELMKLGIPLPNDKVYISQDDMIIGLIIFLDRYCPSEIRGYKRSKKYWSDNVLLNFHIKQDLIPVLVELDMGSVISYLYDIKAIRQDYIVYMIIADKPSTNKLISKGVFGSRETFDLLVILNKHDIIREILKNSMNDISTPALSYLIHYIRRSYFKFSDSISPVKDILSECEDMVLDFERRQNNFKNKNILSNRKKDNTIEDKEEGDLSITDIIDSETLKKAEAKVSDLLKKLYNK